MYLCFTVSQKRLSFPFYFLNNSVNNQSILITFCTRQHRETWHQKINVPTNSCRALGSAKQWFFNYIQRLFLLNSYLSNHFHMIHHFKIVHFSSLCYSECSKWLPSARAAAASVSEMDCIAAAHCGRVDWSNSDTQIPWFCLCKLNTGCNVG